MPYLKKVTINNNNYFYLFHTIRDGNKFRKLSKYIGKDKPSEKELEKIKKQFLKELNENPPCQYGEEEKRCNVVAILQDLQNKKGYLDKEDMIELSKKMEIPGTHIFGVATFYSQFKLKKPGKFKISVCSGTACHVKGSAAIIQYLKDTLGIKPGETTDDGKFTLECVNCIGACAKAPAMMIDDIVYGDLTREKVKGLFQD